MNHRIVLTVLLFAVVLSGLCAQSQNEAEQYAQWARQAIAEGRWPEALAGLERAQDFASVSSDISYLLALARLHEGKSRAEVLEALGRAFEAGRWVNYSADGARLLEAGLLVAMRNYSGALAALDRAAESADAAVLRLSALKGLAANPGQAAGFFDTVQVLTEFRRRLLETMDRYPRDTRPFRVFFEYARNRDPESGAGFPLAPGDQNLMDLALRRLPFVMETDPELAWMAAPFVRDTEQARRLTASYRAGALSPIQVETFTPSPGSIAVALNLGLIDDSEAVEELFRTERRVFDIRPGLTGGAGFAPDGEMVLDKSLIVEIGDLLRSSQGRDLFATRLLSFSGVILADNDVDGYTESCVFYRSGSLREFVYDMDQDGIVDLRVLFGTDGIPVRAEILALPGKEDRAWALIFWEHYPSVLRVELEDVTYHFRPADFQFAPIGFIELGGSRSYSGLIHPVLLDHNLGLGRRTLVSFCSSVLRPSVEFEGGAEQIDLNSGIPLRAVQTLNGKQVSITEFERGLPAVQYIDLDLDGRMETVRRFRRPQPPWDPLDYRSLIASSQSDWNGDGTYTTGEVYPADGSVVYSWDMDGDGIREHSETRTGNQQK